MRKDKNNWEKEGRRLHPEAFRVSAGCFGDHCCLGKLWVLLIRSPSEMLDMVCAVTNEALSHDHKIYTCTLYEIWKFIRE